MPNSPSPDPQNQPAGNKLKDHAGFIYLVSKGLARDQGMRRNLMCWFIMSAVVMLFIGIVFLDGFLRERPLIFGFYWLTCAWLTLSSVLLAVFDILLQFAKGRATRRALTKTVLMEELERAQEKAAAQRKEGKERT